MGFRLIRALRPISGALLQPDPMRMRMTARILFHLHGNDVTKAQLAHRIDPPEIHHPGPRAISNHSGMTRTRSKMNLVGSHIDPLHRPDDLALCRLTGPAGKIVSAYERRVAGATYECRQSTARAKPNTAGINKVMVSP